MGKTTDDPANLTTEFRSQAQAVVSTPKSEGNDYATPSPTDLYPRATAFAKNPASLGIATPADNGMPSPINETLNASAAAGSATPRSGAPTIPPKAERAISEGQEVAFTTPSGGSVYFPPNAIQRKPKMAPKPSVAKAAATPAPNAGQDGVGKPQTAEQKAEIEANLKKNAVTEAATTVAQTPDTATPKKGAVLTPPPTPAQLDAALSQPIVFNRREAIPHGNFTVTPKEPNKIINPAEVLRAAQRNSPLQQQAIRAHAESENAHPDKTISKATGAWRKGVPLNAAVEENQQNFDASVNYWRATVPPGQNLTEYNEQYQSFVASLGEMAVQFAPQLEQMFFRNMPPAVLAEYNDAVFQQQENDKLAIETARARQKAIAERVAKETLIGGLTDYMRQLEMFKAKEQFKTEEELVRSEDRYNKGVALNQQKLEQAETFAAIHEPKQLAGEERKALLTELAKATADVEKAKQLARIKPKKPDDPYKELTIYSDQLATALSNVQKASIEYNKATHDKDGEKLKDKQLDPARVKLWEDELNEQKKNLAFWHEQYGEIVKTIGQNKNEPAREQPTQEQASDTFTDAEIRQWQAAHPDKNPNRDMKETVLEEQMREFKEKNKGKKPIAFVEDRMKAQRT